MIPTWNLLIQEFDRLVSAYEAMRASSFFTDDLWSGESDQSDKSNWMRCV